MNTFKTILVAVDFSTGSRAALEQAARIVGLTGAQLQVLHVVDAAAVAALAASREENYETHLRTATEGAAAALTRWMKQSPTVPDDCAVTIAVGTPLHEILEHVRTLQADLLVAGIAGAGEMPAGAGSVSTKLARKAPSSVLLVRANHPHAFRQIVACIDFATPAREVAELARRVAVQDGASVDFLHVWQEPWVAMSYAVPMGDVGMSAVGPTEEDRESYTGELREELHEFVKLAAMGIDAREVLHEAFSHGNGIAAHAQDSKADLIIVGSKGRTNLHYVLLGSTAERLLTRLPCSLLVVKLSPENSPS